MADRTIPPFPMAAVRYLTAGLLLYPAAWLASRRARERQAQPATGSAARAQGRTRARGTLAQWAGMAVVGTMLLGERLTVTALIGGAIVVASVALLLSKRSRADL